MTKVVKGVLSKVPIFLFCVIFISGYSAFFEKENSIIGVAILTALLIFLKNDFGYDSKSASISLGILMIMMVIMPKLSLINPYVGIGINFIAIMIILALSSYDLEQDNHVPFLLGYIFSGGYDVTGVLFTKRIVSIIIGAILVSGIYFLRTRKNSYKFKLRDVIKSINIHHPNTQWYLKLAITLTVMMFLGDFFNHPRVVWLNCVALSLTYHQHEENIRRIKYRLPATIIGSIVFFILFEYIIPTPFHGMVAVFTGFIMMFINSYFRKTIANSFNALISSMMMFSLGSAVVLRIVSNVIGVGVVIFSHYIFDKILTYMDRKRTAREGVYSS